MDFITNIFLIFMKTFIFFVHIEISYYLHSLKLPSGQLVFLIMVFLKIIFVLQELN